MRIKKLLVLILLCTMIFTMTACSNISVMNISNDDGTINELVCMSLDVEKVLEKDLNIEEIKLDIRNNSIAEADKFVDALNRKIDIDLMTMNDEESIDILVGYKNGISVIYEEWQNNQFSVGIEFKNENVYKYFYNITENINVEPEIEKHFFYNKLTYYGNTIYIKHYSLYESVKKYYSQKYPEFVVSEDVDLSYTYVTDLRRQHSNADHIQFRNGKYYHTWRVDPDNIEERVVIYYNIANKSNCILFCIGLTFAITIIISAVVVIIHFIKNLKTNKNN